jgi:hypothetical protein
MSFWAHPELTLRIWLLSAQVGLFAYILPRCMALH